MNNRVVIIGASGHAKVICDIIIQKKKYGQEIEIMGFLDDNYDKYNDTQIMGYNYLGVIDDINKYKKENCKFIIGIGNNKTREAISNRYREVEYISVIHPNAIIANSVNIDVGTVVMAGSIINTGARIGKHCIINSGAIIEHDVILDDFVHVSPNAALAGEVKVGEGTWIGIGSSVIQTVKIGKHVIVGAGSVVIRSIEDQRTVYGVPAKYVETDVNND